ncbi:hypothetical protein B0T16DRAFT_41320 [Cercophora newfieldiana]|uniref:Fungal N-terminal domain-containing protein n=1 Tax=Cercophora newfieldiana TaxID=92897 RepID=A0AA39YRW5_9PEZI|nr:hypothetical protein B0T16DRAFT_41320 [Cercophora newfieldiana]
MADPLSVSASIVAFVQIASTAARYLVDVNGAPEQIARLSGYVEEITDVLLALQRRKTWPAAVQPLFANDGALDQCQLVLSHLTARLARFREKKRRAIYWPFSKPDINDLLASLEHQKTVFLLALQGEQLALSGAIYDLVSMGQEKSPQPCVILGRDAAGDSLGEGSDEMSQLPRSRSASMPVQHFGNNMGSAKVLYGGTQTFSASQINF